MITAFVYLISGMVLSLIGFRSYISMKKNKNPFFAYFFWAISFYAISYLKGAVLVFIAVIQENTILLFWTDFIGRILFYLGAAVLIQIPLYKFFPNNKKRHYLSYIVCVIGAVLVVYQILNKNIPYINYNLGIVNWQADTVLGAGMALMAVGSWAATAVVFFFEYLNDKRKNLKSLLMGLGFVLAVIGGLFQDLAGTIFEFVFFGFIFMLGFVSIFMGLFYEEERAEDIWNKNNKSRIAND